MENHYTETIAFLYANNENSEREIKESILFTTAAKKKIQYLGISLSKGQGGLACCDSWCCKESDTTERLI